MPPPPPASCALNSWTAHPLPPLLLFPPPVSSPLPRRDHYFGAHQKSVTGRTFKVDVFCLHAVCGSPSMHTRFGVHPVRRGGGVHCALGGGRKCVTLEGEDDGLPFLCPCAPVALTRREAGAHYVLGGLSGGQLQRDELVMGAAAPEGARLMAGPLLSTPRLVARKNCGPHGGCS